MFKLKLRAKSTKKKKVYSYSDHNDKIDSALLVSNDKNKINDSRNNMYSDNDKDNPTMIAEKTTTTTITKISFYHESDILFLSFQQLLFIKKPGATGSPPCHLY